MIDNFEDRLQVALRRELDIVSPQNLRPMTAQLTQPGHVRRGKSTILVIAAAAAVIAVSAVGLVLGTHRDTAEPAARQNGSAANELEIQGARFTVPDGLHAVDASSVDFDITDPYRYCLLGADGTLDSRGCLADGGILIKVARVTQGKPVQRVQGSFQSSCAAGIPIIPVLTEGMIGVQKARVVTVTCGSDAAMSSTYWETTDGALTIQSPFDGAASYENAAAVASTADLSDWEHTS